MGWLPSIFGGGKSSSPIDQLDPKLREFLEKESPIKYNASKSQSTESQAASSKDASPTVAGKAGSENIVPAESLYQDGRYAHLWKSYRPLEQLEEENSTEHDRLMTVLEAFKERKVALGKAAMENCAIQQEEWVNCMKHGQWKDQLQMCRKQVQRYERCYNMQSRFLRALGYGSVLGRLVEVEDDIQMHADQLYQRMLQHEKLVAKAKEEGLPAPVFESVVPKPKPSATEVTEEVEKQWREKLEQLPVGEREAEEAALRADYQAKANMAKTMRGVYDTKKEERESRQAAGQGTFSDTITSLFGSKGK